MNYKLSQSQMNINSNQEQELDESKFILFKKKLNSNSNIKISSSSQDMPFQKCYIIQESNYKRIINYYNTLFGQNKSASTIMAASFNSLPTIIGINTIMTLKEFYIVNKEFLKYLGSEKKLYEQQNIYFHKKDNKIFLLFPNESKENNVLEIVDLNNKDNNGCSDKILENSKKNDIILKKEKIFKKCLLLTAFENDLFKLIEKPINDAYNDIKEYYLINQNWLNIYKNIYASTFIEIKKLMDSFNLSNDKYHYNYFYYYLEELLSQNNIKQFIKNINIQNNSAITDEDNMNPTENQIDKNNNLLKQPIEFVLVPEKLFDLFYEEITIKTKLTKKDFQRWALLGENVLFIQDKLDNKVFYTYLNNSSNHYYTKTNKNLQFYCVFKYAKKNSFFEDINKYIKGKGLLNYLLEKNIKLNDKVNWQNLLNKQNIEGQCLIKEKCPKEFMDIINLKNESKFIYQLFIDYKKLIGQIESIPDYNKNINNINDLKYITNPISIFLINKQEFDFLKNNLLFNDIENIIKENQINNDKIDEFLFNKLKENPTRHNIKNIFSKIKLIDGNQIESILKFQKDKYLFSFINIDLIKPFIDIQNNPSLVNTFNNSHFFLFKNKNEYYIANNNYQKLYKIIVVGNNEFKLEEFNFYGNNLSMVKILKDLVKIEKIVLEDMKSFLKNISSNRYNYFYLINNNWMNFFKKYFNYDTIFDNYKHSAETLNDNIKITQDFPENLKQQNSLIISTTAIQGTNLAFPSNFSIIEKEIFDNILKELTVKYNTLLKMSQHWKIYFGDKKIFIRDFTKKNIFYIYTINGTNNFEIEYILQIDNNHDLTNLLSLCDYNESFEQYLISNFAINIKEAKTQILLDENLDKKGDLIIVKPKSNIRIKKPKHCLGLENIGATCYMNATIQCLCHVFNLKNYFMNRKLMYQSIPKGNNSLSKEFYKVINNLWKNSYHGKSYYTPRDFKNIISQKNPLFQGIAANDSKDLIIFLYETMHTELNNPTNQYNFGQNIRNNQELVNFRNNYYSNNSSIFSKIFYFEQQSELKCMSCNYNKVSYTIYNIIIFPLEKVREYMVTKYNGKGFESVKLEDCFENYQQDEILSGSNQIYCNNCHRMANAANGNKLFTLPEVMTIILNRGKGLEFDVNFEYPIHLNVDKYVMDKNCKNNNYELIAVLSHIGPSGMSGHFIAFCRSPEDNRWYIYNDAQVTECYDPRYHNDDMIEGLPYVLFYQKIDVNKRNNNSQDNNVDDIYMNDENENYIEDPNQITLFFKYDDKEFYLDTNKDNRIRDLIKELNKRYGIPKDSSLCLEGDNELILLEYYNKISQYPKIKNNSKIVVVKN